MMALSPDGQRLAYTTKQGGDVAIVMISLEHPGVKRTVKVELDRDAAQGEQRAATQLRFLRWATSSRLVYAPAERIVPLPQIAGTNGQLIPNPDGPTIISPIMAVDADGRQRGTLVDARNFQETPAEARRTLADLLRTTKELVETRDEPVRWRMPHIDVLGFFPGDREQLIIQTRGAYSMPSQHMVDIRTGSVREFGGDWPAPPGEPHVFDWHRLRVVGERKPGAHPATAWRDEEFVRLQRELEQKFPRRSVELLDWSETRGRVLLRVTGGSDPGRVFVFQRPENLPLEVLRRAPWLNAANLHETRFFECEAPDGAPLTGYVTWPSKPRLDPPPLLVIFPSGFPGQGQPAFDPESQVFADLGFVVARLNHRSVAGVRQQDLNALREAVDRVAVDDVRTVVEWIGARNPARPFDRRRIATLGRGFGGYLAIRALQLQPAVFRCGVAIDAPMDLQTWLRSPIKPGATPAAATRDVPAALIDHAGTDWNKLSVLSQPDALQQPVLLLVEPASNPVIDVSAEALRTRLQALGQSLDYVSLDPGFAAGRPESRAAVYRQIEEFFNLRLHQYAVKIGPAREVE
jgi:dipeptidyl aminopeptidase/acylaminoacyl peptidase